MKRVADRLAVLAVGVSSEAVVSMAYLEWAPAPVGTVAVAAVEVDGGDSWAGWID